MLCMLLYCCSTAELSCYWATAEYCMLYTLCSMLLAWLVNIVLLYHADKSYFSKHLIFHPKHATHCTIFWNYPWYIWTYSKVLKPNKTDIFNIQLVHIYKTYIFCNSIIYKNNSFSVSKISPWLHWTHDSNIHLNSSHPDTTLENQLESPIMTRACKYL